MGVFWGQKLWCYLTNGQSLVGFDSLENISQVGDCSCSWRVWWMEICENRKNTCQRGLACVWWFQVFRCSNNNPSSWHTQSLKKFHFSTLHFFDEVPFLFPVFFFRRLSFFPLANRQTGKQQQKHTHFLVCRILENSQTKPSVTPRNIFMTMNFKTCLLLAAESDLRNSNVTFSGGRNDHLDGHPRFFWVYSNIHENPPWKPKTTMETQPFEDVSPFETWCFSIVMLISLGVSLPSTSHHQDYIIGKRSLYKLPSFVTVSGWGVDPRLYYLKQTYKNKERPWLRICRKRRSGMILMIIQLSLCLSCRQSCLVPWELPRWKRT